MRREGFNSMMDYPTLGEPRVNHCVDLVIRQLRSYLWLGSFKLYQGVAFYPCILFFFKGMRSMPTLNTI